MTSSPVDAGPRPQHADDRRGTRPILLLATLGGLAAVGAFAFDMYLPAFPAIAGEFHVPPGQVQLTLIVALIGLGLGQLAAGPFSDRYGRRVPVLVGLALYTVTSVLIAVAPTIGVFTALRLLQGIGGGIALTISRAVVRDMFRGAQASRYMSRVTLFFGVAPIVAPNAGAAVLAFTGWRGIFLKLICGSCWSAVSCGFYSVTTRATGSSGCLLVMELWI